MATNFPTSLDSLTNPTSSDPLNNPSHADQHANVNDAVEALEAKVGVDSSAVTTSHTYKITQLETNSISKTVIDAKGDLIAGSAADTAARLAASTTNGQVLTVDTSTSTGLKWATPTDDIPKSLVDAKGDLLVGTANDTVGRLAVGGTANHVLVVDSGATEGIKWQGQQEVIVVAISDETTAITTGTAKVTFRMPFAMTLTAVRASLTTASTSGLPTFDINESGVSVLSTVITIDANELTSTTAATPPVISDSALADDAQITIDVDVAGTGAKGAKVYLIGRRV